MSQVLQEMLNIIHNGKMFNKEERTAIKKVSTFLWIHMSIPVIEYCGT